MQEFNLKGADKLSKKERAHLRSAIQTYRQKNPNKQHQHGLTLETNVGTFTGFYSTIPVLQFYLEEFESGGPSQGKSSKVKEYGDKEVEEKVNSGDITARELKKAGYVVWKRPYLYFRGMKFRSYKELDGHLEKIAQA